MKLAIEMAKKGQGFVSPNPLVGCVILDKNHQLLASGYHEQVGKAHAEIHALEQIKDSSTLNGAHLFVTLEPCAHEGRTPSCAKKLATLPLASVTYGLVDPNPLVAGKGIEILKQAGIRVAQDLSLKDELEELAEVFLTNMREKRTFIALKVASSLDGHMAVGEGESQWITSESSRRKAHELRFQYDGVLIGTGTFLKDNPSLNIRGLEKIKDNKVVLIDQQAKSLPSLEKSKILSVRKPDQVVVCTQKKFADDFKKISVMVIVNEENVLDLKRLTSQLYEQQVYSLLVEGGPHTTGHFLKQKVCDRFYLFQAMKLLGKQNWSWSQGFSIERLDQSLELSQIHREFLENDLFLSARLKSKNT